MVSVVLSTKYTSTREMRLPSSDSVRLRVKTYARQTAQNATSSLRGMAAGNGTGSLYNYRKNEFCLYNVSIPNCESGFLMFESLSGNIQPRENGKCSDYLQIFYGNSRTDTLCGDEVPPIIQTTQFLALFWTDPSTNDFGGFKLRAKCRPR